MTWQNNFTDFCFRHRTNGHKKALLNEQQGFSGFYKTYFYELFLDNFYFFLSHFNQFIHFHRDWGSDKYGRISSDKDTE